MAQLAPVPGDLAANGAAVAAHAAADVDLLLTPELSLTGYDIGDAVHDLAQPLEPGAAVRALRDVPGTVVAGVVEAAPGGPYNTAAVVQQGRVTWTHRKLKLPTYGMFDEGRWFGRGARLDTFEPVPGWRCGVLICEDFWHPSLLYVLSVRGIDLLLVPAAAPGRGVWEGGRAGAFASADAWEDMARAAARQYGIWVALSNRVGVEGGVTFAGGSLVCAPDGSVLARADDRSIAAFDVELDPAVRDAARRPFALARDDDPELVLRELRRALEER